MHDWIEVFRTGRHTDSAGQTRDWTGADLATIARQYDPAHHEAPIVLGHPAHDAPAYGWIEALKVERETLLAKPKQLAKELAQWVRDGKYKKVSIALYPDLTLRHLGFLGAMPPAVKGLAQAVFGEAQGTGHGAQGTGWVYFEGWQQSTVQGMFRRLREWVIATAGLETADRVLPGYDIDALAPREEVENTATLSGYAEGQRRRGAEEPRKGGTDMKEFLEKLKAGLVALFAEAEQAIPGSQAGTPAPLGTQVTMYSEADVAARERAAADKATKAAEAKAAEAMRQAQVAQRARDVHGRVTAFVEAGIAKGTFLPAWRDAGLTAVLEQALLVEAPLQYAEGQDPKNPGEILLGFLEGLPAIVPMKEIAKPGAADTVAGDTAAAKLDALTRTHMAANKVAYGVAFLEVQREHLELAAQYAGEIASPRG